jgi:hypothetical protein
MFAVWLTAADLQDAPNMEAVVKESRPWWFALIGVILLIAVVIFIVDRWRKRPPVERLSTGDQLSQFRLLYEQGQLSREEYDRIKATLMPRLRQEMNVPVRPSEGPKAPPAPDEPPPPAPPESGIRPA